MRHAFFAKLLVSEFQEEKKILTQVCHGNSPLAYVCRNNGPACGLIFVLGDRQSESGQDSCLSVLEIQMPPTCSVEVLMDGASSLANVICRSAARTPLECGFQRSLNLTHLELRPSSEIQLLVQFMLGPWRTLASILRQHTLVMRGRWLMVAFCFAANSSCIEWPATWITKQCEKRKREFGRSPPELSGHWCPVSSFCF